MVGYSHKNIFSAKVLRSSAVSFLALVNFACQFKQKEEPPTNVIRPQVAEKAYNATPISYSGSVTVVSGTAGFARYEDSSTGLSAQSHNNPIRYAEYWVTDSAGTQIQQGETTLTGLVSFTIPRTAGSYNLWVNSRADNSQVKASIMKDPYTSEFYQLQSSFSLSGAETTLALSIAEAEAGNSTTLLGGAFNILDMIYVANQFLRDKSTDAVCTVCTAVTVAPKVQVYWQKGLSPGAYYGSPTQAISYFAAQTSSTLYKGLYILGGVQGDVCTDTDHFDKSVLMHEYAHYLESAYGKSSSPGGSHNGQSIIDPRLAWSEGWADFFQGAALGRNIYRDTVRNSACSSGTSLAFADLSLETKATNDVPVGNEGIFREVSVARSLYDLSTGASQGATYNLTADTDSIATNIGFSTVWHAFKTIGGPTYKFQNAGQFNEVVSTMVASAPYSGAMSLAGTTSFAFEGQLTNQTEFGLKLSANGAAAVGSCSKTIISGQPSADTVSGGVVTYTDQLRSNDFFRFDYDGNPANAVIRMRYQHTTSTAPYDLDLYVYKNDYTLFTTSDLVARSEGNYPESTSPQGLEQVSLAGQPAGTYMIHVKAYFQGVRGNTNYYFETSTGVQLCP
jgi:hypothetical protein